MNNDNVVVKFTQSWRGYSAGESAGFSPDQAKALVDGKVAEYGNGAAPKAVGTVAPKAAAKKGAAPKKGASVAVDSVAPGADPDANPGSDLDADPELDPELDADPELDDEPKP